MTGSTSLINLGDLSKPATVLVEKVSNAVGLIYEPYHMKRKARAEIEINKMHAIARMELTELEQRAIERLIHQEARKQDNIEQITAQAAQSLNADAKVESLDEDWVAHFFKQCDTVSDKEMQSLWAKLLSGEASAPGTYSRRTVDFVSSIDKRDAELFSNFCQFAWFMGDIFPLIFDTNAEIYRNQGVNFSNLTHLDAIGLISFRSTDGYVLKGQPKHKLLHYYGRQVSIEFPLDNDNEFILGKVLLTAVGKELAPICGSKKNPEFYEYVVKQLFDKNLILSSNMRARAW